MANVGKSIYTTPPVILCMETSGTDGTPIGISATNPLPITGTITASVTVDSEFPAAAVLADGASAAPTTTVGASIPWLMNATTVDRQRAVVNAMDSTGTGIAAAGLMAQFDDAATGTVTENQFSTLRMSSRRALLVEGVASGTAQAASIADGSDVAEGALADAAVVAGATGSISAKLRSISRDLVANIVLATGANIIGRTGVDQTTPGTTNHVAIISGQAGIAGGTGVDGATVPRVSLATNVALPAGTNNIGDVDVLTTPKCATGTVTVTADNAASVTILASNANRKGFVITNDSSARCYIKLGATAATTSYTVSLGQHGTYEQLGDGIYTGVIDAIWASDPNDGGVKVTELTA